MTFGVKFLFFGTHVILLLLWAEIDTTVGYPFRHNYPSSYKSYPQFSDERAPSEDVLHSLYLSPNDSFLDFFSTKVEEPSHYYGLLLDVGKFPISGIDADIDARKSIVPKMLFQLDDVLSNDNAIGDTNHDLQSYKHEDNEGFKMLFRDEMGTNVSKRGDRPSLSIVSPLDVLSQRLLLEMVQRRMKQSQHQIQANAEFLRNLGKRDITHQPSNIRGLQ
ncbi:uncharacterized protein LOC143252839 [Tachypleus tridentatus]|uniref:uncharacterized protein LOC143252839 n=1 Tax=Tachypleus tridentatus TaxID=6853 RepID=UPI003FD34785